MTVVNVIFILYLMFDTIVMATTVTRVTAVADN